MVPVGGAIAQVPGLRWKIWLKNEEANEGGGLYLFDDEAALQAFLGGPIIERFRSPPALNEISVKGFDAATDLTELTRSPVNLKAFA